MAKAQAHTILTSMPEKILNKSPLFWILSTFVVSTILLCAYFFTGSIDRKENESERATGVGHLNLTQPLNGAAAANNSIASPANIWAPQSLPYQSSASSTKSTDKRSEVLGLIKTADPARLFKAYQIVARCVASKEKYVASQSPDNGTTSFHVNNDAYNEGQLCDNLTNSEIMQRMQWLEAAAAAGVGGAAQAFANAGPGGFGNSTEITDTDWAARLDRYLHIGSISGDIYSSIVLSDRHESGPMDQRDPLKALAYYELAMDASRARDGKPLHEEERTLKRMQSKLTPEQLAKLPQIKANLLRKEN